ncbi:FxLYD domain-containing protein [Thermosynechococcus vestitus]|uniref:Tlr0074 protein n=1 Tax=Thermosynechococcus vestitus (strain NIES-2133 / IAM M-273 / BP-1) TaxID=197221 RepID=Q8DMN7_THEVB|nr:FxLYD domain-containing protein [Thermosynechococcus vestitus]BAC07627.1 tlr0074 [Thermosynechococcus vestitus BP-1]
MPNLRTIWLCGLLLTTWGGLLSLEGMPAIARRREVPKVVRVTDLQLQSENIAGVWYHRLTGRVRNETATPARNVQIYYEIYDPTGKRLLEAGSTQLHNRVIDSEGEAEFLATPNAGGRVKITLVEWLSGDRDYHSFQQMQEF